MRTVLLAAAALGLPALALAQTPITSPATPAAPPVVGTIAAPEPAPEKPAPEKAEKAEKKMPEDKSKRPSPPATAAASVRGTEVRIDYSRPSLKGRAAFGDKTPLAPASEVWRTGANEATTFTVSKAVTVEGQPLSAGTYGLFTIPGPTEWTIIFNKTAQQWGAYKYDASQDALRVKVKPRALTQPVEQFTISVDKAGKVALLWDKTEVDFRVK